MMGKTAISSPNPATARLLYVSSEDFAFLSHRLPMARAARDAGFEVHVATHVNGGRQAIEAEGFRLHAIPFSRGGLSPRSALGTAWALRKLIRRVKPDIIHHSGLQACMIGAVANVGRHQPQVHAMTGLGYIFTSHDGQARWMRSAVTALLRKLLVREASVVLVQNPDDRTALEQIGLPSAKITLIPGSGVDTQCFTPIPEPDAPITIGFAGRLLFDKGIRALVEANRLVRAEGHDVRLLIAGRTDPANPATLSEAEVESWRNEPGITVMGQVTDITELWRASHVAALPSHREGLPMSLMEAAACGRPMIATDAPGCREIVMNDVTGLLVPIEDAPALADAIRTLAASPSLRERYGAAARQLVVDKMSATAIGAATVQLYRQVLAAQPH